MPFDLASSATANNSRTFFAKSLRADASEARRVLVCCAWSEAISDMSSVLRFIVAACPTLNCQKIRPREKTMPHPATIQAFVFEFKIRLFLSNKTLWYTGIPACCSPGERQCRDDARWKRAYGSGLLN